MKKDIVFKAVLVLAIFLLVYQFGIKPLIGDILFGGVNKNKYIEAIPGSSSDVYDVIVFGEEPDGIAAAVAAARLGARVLLLSGGNDLGGVVEDSLLTNLELPLGSDGEILNKGMLTELTGQLGRQFSILSYKSVIYTFTNNEKSLEIK
ncbi:MAG: FAD-dependent oxidoreductase, partial [Clostridiales bacterium]|nr:FAD-dependent oxidoreductase [Clostridiales bacterium]